MRSRGCAKYIISWIRSAGSLSVKLSPEKDIQVP